MLGNKTLYKFNLEKTYSIGNHNDIYGYKFTYSKQNNSYKTKKYKTTLSNSTLFMPLLLNKQHLLDEEQDNNVTITTIQNNDISTYLLKLKKL